MKLLGIDLETGKFLEDEDNFITEIGLVLWDKEQNSPININSFLLNFDKEPRQECIELNNLTKDYLKNNGRTLTPELKLTIFEHFNNCDIYVAHNGLKFDKPVLEDFFKKEMKMDLPEKLWIDTQYHIDYPKSCKHFNLTYLSAFHGLLNQFPHRAVMDSLIMMGILSIYDIDEVIENAKSPLIVIRALVDFDNKELAKQLGFKWQNLYGKIFDKSWVKEIRRNQLDNYKNCGFEIKIL